MSKLEEKYLQEYSIDTLRDSGVSSPVEGDLLRYDGSQWVNNPEPNFGKDFNSNVKINLETESNGVIQYDLINFNGSGGGSNRYRVSTNFVYRGSSASRNVIFQLRVDNQIVRLLEIEPKDPQTDQRIDGTMTFYVDDLADGNHTLAIWFGSEANQITCTMYESTLEVWRVE